MKSRGSRKLTSENPPTDAAAKAGAIWEPVDCCSKRQLEDPTRYQRVVSILNLEKLTALECIINLCSGRPLATQENVLYAEKNITVATHLSQIFKKRTPKEKNDEETQVRDAL